jgi:hypothetical protein
MRSPPLSPVVISQGEHTTAVCRGGGLDKYQPSGADGRDSGGAGVVGTEVGRKNMVQEINFFAEDPGRYERFQQHFIAQNIIDDVIDEICEQHGDALKEREGGEIDLSRLVGGLCFGKAHKTSHATIRLCALGLGEDAAILLRSNINILTIYILF